MRELNKRVIVKLALLVGVVVSCNLSANITYIEIEEHSKKMMDKEVKNYKDKGWTVVKERKNYNDKYTVRLKKEWQER